VVEQGTDESGAADLWGQDAPEPGEDAPVTSLSERVSQFAQPRRADDEARGDIEARLDQTAQTTDRLLAEVESSRDGMARLQTPRDPGEGELGDADHRSPEEIVGDVLVTAHRAAEAVIENAQRDAAWIETTARREALPIVAEAQRMLEDARRLHGEAEQALVEAHREANAVLEAAQAERGSLIASWTTDAERRRAELEAAGMRLETTIRDLRAEWIERIGEALALLDGLEVETDPPSPDEAAPVDVMQDLHPRIAETSEGTASSLSDQPA
jgi:hypothetical protein